MLLDNVHALENCGASLEQLSVLALPWSIGLVSGRHTSTCGNVGVPPRPLNNKCRLQTNPRWLLASPSLLQPTTVYCSGLQQAGARRADQGAYCGPTGGAAAGRRRGAHRWHNHWNEGGGGGEPWWWLKLDGSQAPNHHAQAEGSEGGVCEDHARHAHPVLDLP